MLAPRLPEPGNLGLQYESRSVPLRQRLSDRS
jgi:hypothetical protein